MSVTPNSGEGLGDSDASGDGEPPMGDIEGRSTEELRGKPAEPDAEESGTDLEVRPTEDLKRDVEKADDDADLARQLNKEQLRQARQANRLREWFFVIANTLAGLTVLTSICLVVATLLGAPVASTVAVAFISALAVETVGILAVIAGYLFPRDRPGSNDQRERGL